VAGIPWEYGHSTVRLQADGLGPQPVIPVISGFHCLQCSFRNNSQKNTKVHGNRAHSMKRVADEELSRPVPSGCSCNSRTGKS
jgi:hypothetical protein